jgi:hypothetical protein
MPLLPCNADRQLFCLIRNEDELKRLLETYGNGTKGRPEYPFVRMVSDGIWPLSGDIQWQPNKDFTLTERREGQV